MTPAPLHDDKQIILTAYETAVAKLYATLFDAFLTSAGDATLQQQAEQRFSSGLNSARQSRDRALALI